MQSSSVLGDAIHETQSLLQNLVDDLSPSSETAHRILRKIKGGSIRWPFEKNDILKRINSLERCMQVINKSLQVDQTLVHTAHSSGSRSNFVC